MSYHFCVGPSGSGKTCWLHDQVISRAVSFIQRLPSGHTQGTIDNYVIVVPDQFSLQTQKELVDETSCHGIMNIDVQSFGRLTHKIFGEVGAPAHAVLDDIGKTLLLMRVAGQHEKDLTVLAGKIRRPGMIAEVKSVLSEFMQYGLEAEDISEMSKYAGRSGQGALAARLSDLEILYRAFHEGERDRFLTSEETLDLLADAIPESAMVKRSCFIFDGFTGFTPVQYRVLTALIANAKEVWISLTLGKDGGRGLVWTEQSQSAGQQEALFYLSRKTIRDLGVRARREGLTHGDDKIFNETPRFAHNPVMAHLEANLFRYPAIPYAGFAGNRITLTENNTAEDEVRQICMEIHRKVMDEGYEYRDIAVVTGDLESYGELFEKQAALYDIPVYVDRTSAVMLNPLTEAVSSALQISAQSFSYEAVFRYLRSGMSNVTRSEADILENYCLKHGIRGRRKWALPFDAECEPVRLKFLSEIAPLVGELTSGTGTDANNNDNAMAASRESGTGMTKKIRTASQRTLALYALMTNCGMEQKMQALTQQFHEKGDSVREKQYSQLYGRVIELLEQIYDLLGDEKISARDYEEILEAGFAQIKLGTLPQQVDRVLVGDIERTRLSQMKVLFLAGVSDGNIPHGTSKGGLLSDLDREFLASSGTELAPTPRQQMYLQRLYLYINMTKPSDMLCLSWSRTSSDGKSQRPSYLIQNMQKLFPDLEVRNPQNKQFQEQLVGEKDSISWLSGAMRNYADGLYDSSLDNNHDNGPDTADQILTAYGFLRRYGSDEAQKRLESLQKAAFLRYDPVWISPQTAHNLYGDSLMGGISRMETGAKCFLRHFLQYGLRLREREEFILQPADSGTILHESLERFSRKLADNGLNWKLFDAAAGRKLAAQALEETAAGYRDLILYDTHRSEHQMLRMQKILERSVDTMQYQLRKGLFTPSAFEFTFGPGGDADTISFRIDSSHGIRLVGRIDRLDLCEENGKLYIKIVDYKSGRNQLDILQMRRGLQLQLLFYMNAILDIEKKRRPGTEAVPAAMLYYQMTDPVLEAADSTTPSRVQKDDYTSDKNQKTDTGRDDEDDPQTEQELKLIRARLRPTGMVNSSPDALKALDMTLTGRSDVIPVSLKNDGTPRTGSKVYTAADFDELTKAVVQKICSIALEILEGNVTANPAQIDKSRTACDYCPVRNVCGFDPKIPGYRYREE